MDHNGVQSEARTGTQAACTAARQFFNSEKSKRKSHWPEDGKKLVGIQGSSSGSGFPSGGEGDVDLEEIDASHEGYDPEERNYEYRDVGRVGYIVNFSSNPVIEIYHSNTQAARDMGTRMLSTLSTQYNAKIVSSNLTANQPLNAAATKDGQWMAGLSRRAPSIIFCAILCIAFILVWSLAEYMTLRKFNRHRQHCKSCGYDLRGSPGDRCSECGSQI